MQIQIITKQNRIDALQEALQVSENRNEALTSLVLYGTATLIGSAVVSKASKAVAQNIRDSFQERKAARKAAKATAVITADDLAQAMFKAQQEFARQHSNDDVVEGVIIN